MTVTIVAKHEIAKTDNNDNEACCMADEPCEIHDHTQSLLEDLTEEYQVITRVTEITNGKVTATCETIYVEKCRQLLTFEDAPEYIKHNTYIRTGYRGCLDTGSCLESIFWWSNETINIWSHIFGLFLFIALAINDLLLLKVHASMGDKIIVASVLICFQICMLLSALYHTFSCRSEKDCDTFLCLDLFGIALSLLAIYTSGIYYAFWCEQDLQNFYLLTVTLIFIVAMMLQLPSLGVDSNIKMLVFVGWAAYGVVPTLHWTIHMGGFENPVVALLFPRVIGMYVISGIAFFIYITKIPERFYSGKFDFLGHSHQWWHLFVVAALYYWHNTGMLYVDYRLNHACSGHMRLPNNE